MWVGILLLAVGVASAFQTTPLNTNRRHRYDGYKVFSVVPTDRQTLDVLHKMTSDVHVDFWKEPARLNQKVTFMAPPQHLIRIVTDLRKAGVEFTIDHQDVEAELISPMWSDIDKRYAGPEPYAFDINDYNSIEDLYAWMETDLVASCRAGFTCEVYSLGNSYEGRPINLFKMSKPDAGRMAYWVDATIHAREWIATATITNIMNHVVTGGDADAIRLADAYDFYFVPVMNPDGYSYSWSDERLWRKNRFPSTALCYGIDLNRNFDFRWGNDGVSHQPCDDTYCGESGGSELETQAVSAELVRIGSTLGAVMTLHSYGNMWLFPWGNTVNYEGNVCDFADDHDDMMAVSDPTADAIENTYNTRWSRGNSCDVIYSTTGGTDDYAKGAAGVKYAFCPELRGNSFILPKEQIPLSFNEIWNGLVVMVDTINV